MLEVESPESYIKRPASSMITIEISNVMKLPRGILLPSLDLRDPIDAIVMQCISYFGLPNQCRRFYHFAKNCPCVPVGDGKGSYVSRQQS